MDEARLSASAAKSRRNDPGDVMNDSTAIHRTMGAPERLSAERLLSLRLRVQSGWYGSLVVADAVARRIVLRGDI